MRDALTVGDRVAIEAPDVRTDTGKPVPRGSAGMIVGFRGAAGLIVGLDDGSYAEVSAGQAIRRIWVAGTGRERT